MTHFPITPGDSLAAVVAELRELMRECRFAGNFTQAEIYRIQADRIERLDAEMRKEIEQRNRWLAECYRISGADPSGGMKGDVSEDWRLAQNAVEAVTDFRRDYDEACEEAHQLRAKLAACEPLVAACEAEFDVQGKTEDGEQVFPDEDKVSYPEATCHITFGMIRKARAAIASRAAGESK